MADEQEWNPQGVLDIIRERSTDVPLSEAAENVLPPGPGHGLKDVIARGDIALRSDTVQEALSVFRQHYPEGDLIRHPKSGEMMFRTSPQEPYRMLDPSIWTDEGWKSDLPGDIADAMGILPTAAAEIGLFSVTKNPTGLRGAFTAMLGGAAGEGARQGLQSLTGSQRESGAGIAANIGFEAATAGTGELVSKPMIAAANLAGRRAMVGLKRGAEAAQQFAKEVGLPALTPGQMSTSPLLRLFESQARAISSGFADLNDTQITEALGLLRGKGVPLGPNATIQETTTAVRIRENQILGRLKHFPAGNQRAGRALEEGFEIWDKAKKHNIDQLYEDARAAAEAGYDVTSLKDVAETIRVGRTGVTDEGIEIPLDPKLETELREVIDDILSLDPNLPTSARGTTATEQLMALRMRLWELKTPQQGERFSFSHGRAARLYRALTDAMNKPDVPTDAVAKWQKAANAARERFDVWDRSVITLLAKAKDRGNTSRLAAQLLSEGRADDIAYLREIMPAAQFRVFNDYASAQVLRDPGLLDRLDPDVLNAVFTPAQIDDIRHVVDDLAVLRAPELRQLVQEGWLKQDSLRRFLSDATPASVESFYQAVKTNPQAMVDTKAALIDILFSKVSRQDSDRLSLAGYKEGMAALEEHGLLRFFTKEDQQVLRGLEKYVKFVERRADVGTSLMAAGVAGGLKTFAWESLHQLASTIGVGRFLLSPAGRAFFIGVGREPHKMPTVRALAATIGAWAGNTGETGSQREEGNR